MYTSYFFGFTKYIKRYTRMAKFDISTKKELQYASNLGKGLFDNLKAVFFSKIKNGEFFYAKRATSKSVHKIKVYNGVKNPVWDKLIDRGLVRKRKTAKFIPGKKELEVRVSIKGKEEIIRFIATGKKSNGGGENSPSKKTYSSTERTVFEEEVSLMFIKRAIEDNKTYTKWAGDTPDCVVADKNFYKELKKVHPIIEDNTDWQESFMAQGRRMLEEARRGGWSEFKHYDRGSPKGFMDYITDVVKKYYNIPQKDTWNPADIWLVKDQRKVQEDIENTIKNSNGNIGVLNEVLKKMFITGRVIGISLKKITKPKQGAWWKIYNVEDPKFKEFTLKRDFKYEVGPTILCRLNMKDGNKPPMATQETKLWLKEGGKDAFEFTIKGVQGVNKRSSLKFEPIDKQRAAARLGKSPVKKVRELMTDLNIGAKANKKQGFTNDHNVFPSNLADFKKDKKLYADMWEGISKKVTTGVRTKEEFIDNIELQYVANPNFAQQKLMQVNFLYVILKKLNKDQRDKFFSDLLFMAEKFGDKYGPFGKLY